MEFKLCGSKVPPQLLELTRFLDGTVSWRGVSLSIVPPGSSLSEEEKIDGSQRRKVREGGPYKLGGKCTEPWGNSRLSRT